MIKYYDTEAAYKADTAKGATESQVSLIKASNGCRYDGRNVVVGLRSARTGSVAVLDGSHALHFIASGTFKAAGLPEGSEAIGVVVIGVDHPDFRGEVAVMSKTFAAAAMLERWFLELTGFVLDGTDRAGTLSVREASDNWTANHDYVISYNASTVEELVAQLNAYFKANEPFAAQDWVAVAGEDGGVTLHFSYTNWQQASYNTAKSGFSATATAAPGWVATSKMLRMNGARNGEGAITNRPRALAYFRNDNSSTTYNPATDINTKKTAYPICLPGYLGTSQYQSDHCAFLRGVYGDGEEGWLRFMESFLPVRPSEYGIFDKDTYGTGTGTTYYLAGIKYTGSDGTEKYASPAARLAADLGYDHELLKQGEWVLPDIDRVFSIVGQLRYPTTNDRDADPVNAALKAIGAPSLGNGSYVWSCSRYGSYGGWLAGGGSGYAAGYSLSGRGVAVPLVLLNVAAGGAA